MNELWRKLRYWLAYLIASDWIDDLEHRFSVFLYEQTGGQMSKCYYTTEAMRSVANDYLQRICDECEADAVKEFAEELKCGVSITSGIITCEDVDKLVKKKVGDGE